MNSNVFVTHLLLAIKPSVVVNRYLKLGGRAIITCNVDLVSSPNRDIAGLCTEASAEDGLFLELKGHRGLPPGNVHHFLNVDHVAHHQIIKNHPRALQICIYEFCLLTDFLSLSLVLKNKTMEKRKKALEFRSHYIVIMPVMSWVFWYESKIIVVIKEFLCLFAFFFLKSNKICMVSLNCHAINVSIFFWKFYERCLETYFLP